MRARRVIQWRTPTTPLKTAALIFVATLVSVIMPMVSKNQAAYPGQMTVGQLLVRTMSPNIQHAPSEHFLASSVPRLKVLRPLLWLQTSASTHANQGTWAKCVNHVPMVPTLPTRRAKIAHSGTTPLNTPPPPAASVLSAPWETGMAAARSALPENIFMMIPSMKRAKMDSTGLHNGPNVKSVLQAL